jgi:cardiolipin synthase A/B
MCAHTSAFPAATEVPCVTSGPYPLRPGNAVRPLIDGLPAYRRIGEAVDLATRSVWVTVAFLVEGFRMPGGRGTFFELLDRAARRGLDVRLLFWRVNPETEVFAPRVFSGTAEHRRFLREHGYRFEARWDRAATGCCQHQKSWVIDAGTATETTFVGGINLNPDAMVEPGHAGPGQIHDAYVELRGPSGTDVHHNFVQRWNEASERGQPDGVWPATGGTQLPFPSTVSAPRGGSCVQVQRTMPGDRYSNCPTTPGGAATDIAAGERSILDQYLAAIRAARRSIYIENQAFELLEVAEELRQALDRGVRVAVLVPAEPAPQARTARAQPSMRSFTEHMHHFAGCDDFTLFAISGTSPGGRSDVYVHSKLMAVDDRWATVGSCNLHRASVAGNAELNVSVWDPHVARALRCELMAEHLGHPVGDLDDRTALSRLRELANRNRRRRDEEDSAWEGLVFALDPTSYCLRAT